MILFLSVPVCRQLWRLVNPRPEKHSVPKPLFMSMRLMSKEALLHSVTNCVWAIALEDPSSSPGLWVYYFLREGWSCPGFCRIWCSVTLWPVFGKPVCFLVKSLGFFIVTPPPGRTGGFSGFLQHTEYGGTLISPVSTQKKGRRREHIHFTVLKVCHRVISWRPLPSDFVVIKKDTIILTVLLLW